MIKIGLDLMGGDFAPEATIEGAIQAQKVLDGKARLVLIGDTASAKEALSARGVDEGLFAWIDAPEVIGMGEHPAKAFQAKPNSSIALGFGGLKKGDLDAFASAGNTGAMMAGCFFILKTIPGVLRPAIAGTMPNHQGSWNLLVDVGLNPEPKAENLVQFAVLGSVYTQAMRKIERPRVGLLNVGTEEGKGSVLQQTVYGMLKADPRINFIGNVEGRDISTDAADVIVCDGVTGNVALKQAESLYEYLHEAGIQEPFLDRFNYELYGGTPVLGVDKSVIIGHGISSALAIQNMVITAFEVAQSKVTDHLAKAFQA